MFSVVLKYQTDLNYLYREGLKNGQQRHRPMPAIFSSLHLAYVLSDHVESKLSGIESGQVVTGGAFGPEFFIIGL